MNKFFIPLGTNLGPRKSSNRHSVMKYFNHLDILQEPYLFLYIHIRTVTRQKWSTDLQLQKGTEKQIIYLYILWFPLVTTHYSSKHPEGVHIWQHFDWCFPSGPSWASMQLVKTQKNLWRSRPRVNSVHRAHHRWCMISWPLKIRFFSAVIGLHHLQLYLQPKLLRGANRLYQVQCMVCFWEPPPQSHECPL